jgi:hypothetical protein
LYPTLRLWLLLPLLVQAFLSWLLLLLLLAARCLLLVQD